MGHSPWGHEELDTTERFHFHFSLSCIGEGNGNPLQCSCLENPRDGGAWWAAICGVAQSWTRLKQLSSSSSSRDSLCVGAPVATPAKSQGSVPSWMSNPLMPSDDSSPAIICNHVREPPSQASRMTREKSKLFF